MTLEIKSSELKKIIENGGQLIDVRTPAEFNQASLQHAVNMPIESMPTYAEELDRSKPVLIYCLSGIRARMVKRFLESLGFEKVHNLGGIRQLAHG